MSRGCFISFEGVDGAGKTTQLERAIAWLREHPVTRGRELVVTREPGGTDLSEAVRGVLFTRRAQATTPWAEVLLLAAARAQHVREKLAPALERGALVVCDRYSDSTMAYQGAARGLPAEDVASVCRIAEQGVVPDLTILYDLSVEDAAARLAQRADANGEITPFDEEQASFHQAVRGGYQALARAHSDRIVTIDAAASIDDVWHRTSHVLATFLDTYYGNTTGPG